MKKKTASSEEAQENVSSIRGRKKRKSDRQKNRSEKVSVFRRSIGAQLTLILAVALAASLVLIGVCNYCFLPGFYRANKIKRLKAVYEQLDAEEDHSQISNKINETLIQENMNLMITDSGLTLIYPEAGSEKNLKNKMVRLFGYVSNFYFDHHGDGSKREEAQILEKNDQYAVQITEDDFVQINYLEMWGTFGNGDKFLLQTPMESLRTASRLSTGFYIIIGVIVMVIAAIVSYFIMKRYTKPVRELTAISKKMANLDFDARYSGETTDEIGQLGMSFNKMSDELEKNISELKTANTELMKDNEKKTKIDEMRREFLNNVTHELKTPIALIQGYAEGLKDNIAEDDASRDFYCDVIVDESAKMNNMVRQLLTLNRLEFGNDAVEMDRFDLTQLVAGVIQGMGIMIRDNEATVSFDGADPVYVWGDEFKIEEVVTNYLSNACHHVEGERRIEVKMEEMPGGVVRTTVFNTGLPIPEDSIGHVFEKFYKVDKARTRAYGGSGIGLSIVKAIMDGHHQKYGVKNYENGVAFWFDLEAAH